MTVQDLRSRWLVAFFHRIWLTTFLVLSMLLPQAIASAIMEVVMGRPLALLTRFLSRGALGCPFLAFVTENSMGVSNMRAAAKCHGVKSRW